MAAPDPDKRETKSAGNSVRKLAKRIIKGGSGKETASSKNKKKKK
jgi:hypothetical protein